MPLAYNNSKIALSINGLTACQFEHKRNRRLPKQDEASSMNPLQNQLVALNHTVANTPGTGQANIAFIRNLQVTISTKGANLSVFTVWVHLAFT